MDKFDVVIIGGGLGGLSCGAILSKEGLSVCILEQQKHIGGCLQSFMLKTVDIRSPKTVISVHFSYSLPMAMQIY